MREMLEDLDSGVREVEEVTLAMLVDTHRTASGRPPDTPSAR
jgi:hypothetical protein